MTCSKNKYVLETSICKQPHNITSFTIVQRPKLVVHILVSTNFGREQITSFGVICKVSRILNRSVIMDTLSSSVDFRFIASDNKLDFHHYLNDLSYLLSDDVQGP